RVAGRFHVPAHDGSSEVLVDALAPSARLLTTSPRNISDARFLNLPRSMARMIAGLFCRANSMAIDPICGMTVDESTGRHAERDGQMFYFCSEHCRQRFLADKHQAEPGHARAHHEHPQAPAKQPSPGKYICPMCTGVASDRPGNCPKCGMALEPARP